MKQSLERQVSDLTVVNQDKSGQIEKVQEENRGLAETIQKLQDELQRTRDA